MKANDLLIELDYYSLRYILIEGYEWMVQCNPRMLTEFEKDFLNNPQVKIWDKTTGLRNIINGELRRRGYKMQKPIRLSFNRVLEISEYMHYWFKYRVDWGVENIKKLEEEKCPLEFIKMAQQSNNTFEKWLEKLSEYISILNWKFKGHPKPPIDYCFWLDENYDLEQDKEVDGRGDYSYNRAESYNLKQVISEVNNQEAQK